MIKDTIVKQCIICILFVVCSRGVADNPVIQSKGIGTKALGLANAFTAIADDYSAVYWNPAGLAFTPVREFQVSFDYLDAAMESDFGGILSQTSRSRFRFSEAGLLRSVPTTRGGFAFALGFSSPYILDNIVLYRGQDRYNGTVPVFSPYFSTHTDTINGTVVVDTVFDSLTAGQWLIFDTAKTNTYGQINAINTSVGWQVSEGLGVGVTVSFLFGKEHQTIRTHTFRPPGGMENLFNTKREEINRSYKGLELRTGILYKPLDWWSFGINLALPQQLKFTQEYIYKDMLYGYIVSQEKNSATLKTPFSGSAGTAVTFPFMRISAQIDFRTPVASAAEGSERAHWKAGGGAGIEVPVKILSTVFRAGYAVHEVDVYPFEIQYNDKEIVSFDPLVKNEQYTQMVTAGVSVLFGNAFVLDAGYSYTKKAYDIVDSDWMTPIEENHTLHRIQCSISVQY